MSIRFGRLFALIIYCVVMMTSILTNRFVNKQSAILHFVKAFYVSPRSPVISRFAQQRSISTIWMQSMDTNQLSNGGSNQNNATSFTAPISNNSTSILNNHQKDSDYKLLTNQELVRRRIAKQHAKRQARQQTIQERISKNYHIKRLLHNTTAGNNNDEKGNNDNNNSTSTSYNVPPLYAVKVWVDDALRKELRLSGREKRGRVFIEKDSKGTSTIKGFKEEIHGFFTALKKDTYLLRATLPSIDSDGTIISSETKDDAIENSWKIETNDDVIKTFAMADEYFHNVTCTTENGLKRPSIQINVLKNPNAPPPPPIPSYLQNMSNPSESETITMISFYAFPPYGIDDPEEFALELKKKWKPFHVLGRIYVAQEGINAQMSVPTNILPNFMDCCRSIPELGQYMENDINIDPKPLSKEEFAISGVPVNGKPAPPFRNLHIRVRRQVVADGLDKPLNWQYAGYDMPPLEWHAKLKEAKEKREVVSNDNPSKDFPILLDCRNTYETDVGIFEEAEPLGTQNFRESWDVLKERLADTPKDTPIMTYCTGGIRCVKVGAYLTQELGFTNVSRLAGGIIAYDRTLTEQTNNEESMFKGTNFVFDGRLGRPITDDTLGNCITCGAETSLVSNCRNDNCHQRIVQCESCRTSYHGTCSAACKNRVINSAMTPARQSKASSDLAVKTSNIEYKDLDEYSLGHSSPAPSVYKEIELNTQKFLQSGSHMVSGEAQGRLLTQFASMTRNGRILELGTFTGYATACLLEGASIVAKLLGTKIDSTIDSTNEGPYVLSMERDIRAFSLAAAHLKAIATNGFVGEDAAKAVCALRNTDQADEISDNPISVIINQCVRCDLLRVTDALATVEVMASGTIDNTGIHLSEPFDMVFVDADKTRLLEYIEACLGSDRLLKKGGVIIVDNVLWKGLVLEASRGEFASVSDSEETGQCELRKNRRARKLATTMHRFNEAIVKDGRVEVMVLPIRDGLSVIRKLS